MRCKKKKTTVLRGHASPGPHRCPPAAQINYQRMSVHGLSHDSYFKSPNSLLSTLFWGLIPCSSNPLPYVVKVRTRLCSVPHQSSTTFHVTYRYRIWICSLPVANDSSIRYSTWLITKRSSGSHQCSMFVFRSGPRVIFIFSYRYKLVQAEKWKI